MKVLVNENNKKELNENNSLELKSIIFFLSGLVY